MNKKRRIDEDVAKLACQDDISFVRIAWSSFIQESFKKFDYDSAPPSSSLSVKNMVMKYAEEKKESLRTYFENEAKLGKRFALTLDEYTSLQNVRYININVHDENTHWSLGMEKLRESINSARLTEIVSKKLTEFNLELNKHIVGCTTDGASVMVKFGKEIAPFHQQCVAHTIHLSVCDVLYTNRNDIEQTEIPAQNEKTSDENEDVDHENNVLGFESQEDVTVQFSEDYRDIL